MDFDRQVDQSKYSDTMPEYPARTLFIHVAAKGIQAGSVIGFAMTPLHVLYSKQPLSLSWRKCSFFGTVIGLTGAMSMLAVRQMTGSLTVEGVDDRAYRISKNLTQRKVDQYAVLGGAGGAAAGAIIGKLGMSSILAGSTTGVALSIAAYSLEKVGAFDKLKEATKGK